MYVDLAKAFDIASHEILLKNQKNKYFQGNCCKFNNTTRNNFRTIFLYRSVYLNDIFNLNCQFKLHRFVDDTVFFMKD